MIYPTCICTRCGHEWVGGGVSHVKCDACVLQEKMNKKFGSNKGKRRSKDWVLLERLREHKVMAGFRSRKLVYDI